MTLDEAILTLYETLGEPSDFNPYGSNWSTIDNTTKGYSKLKGLLNSGQTACANFKQGRMAQVRFSNLISSVDVTVKEITAPYDVDNTDTYKLYINKADLPNPAIAEISDSGRFENSYLTIYNEQYTVDYDNYDEVTERWELFLTEEVPTDPTDRTVKIIKNSFMFLPKTHPWVGENFKEPVSISYGVGRGNLTYILNILNLADQTEITKASIAENFISTSNETDTPTEYILLGREIKFNTIPTSGTRFQIEYYRTPSKLEDGGEQFEIPEQFHYGIIMWAAWQGLIRMHELETSSIFKRDWYDFMQTTKNDNDYRWERTKEGSGTIRRT